MSSVFIRAVETADKAQALAAAIRGQAGSASSYCIDPNVFRTVTGSPFAYWASSSIFAAFTNNPAAGSGNRVVVSTNPLNDDFRHIRVWWEVNLEDAVANWTPWAKGGSYSPFYYDIDTVIRWDQKSLRFHAFVGTANRPLERPASAQHFTRPGLTWPRRTDGLSFRIMPCGSIFADKGPAIFVQDDDESDLLALCAIVNSKPFRSLVDIQLARTELAQSYEVGLIQKTPVPDISPEYKTRLAALARSAWRFQRRLDEANETSHAFILPDRLLAARNGFDEGEIRSSLEQTRKQIDEEVFRLYALDPDDCFAPKEISSSPDGHSNDSTEGGLKTPEGSLALLSWSVGVAFGRFDVALATGERELPSDPEPFDALPARSPGMGPQVMEDRQRSVLVDDPGHPSDLPNLVATVLQQVSFTPIEDFHSDMIRHWLAHDFWPYHIRMYTKSRRKAPIYWQLATASASYSVWLYLHRLTRDTFYRLQNEYTGPKLEHEMKRLQEMRAEAMPTPSPHQRKNLEVQERFVEEVHVLHHEVGRIAPLWNPDLNDGVIINFAPLWRLVPHNKSWQNELKAAWEAVSAGAHDWSRLAMHLWPERVVPKCAADRSLAIAHGLEDVFWTADESGRWKPRTVPTRPEEELVKERASDAVKAALRDLLEAPEPAGAARRGRRKS